MKSGGNNDQASLAAGSVAAGGRRWRGRRGAGAKSSARLAAAQNGVTSKIISGGESEIENEEMA
jgi:hypothetical protein